jgi:hypothetical protein
MMRSWLLMALLAGVLLTLAAAPARAVTAHVANQALPAAAVISPTPARPAPTPSGPESAARAAGADGQRLINVLALSVGIVIFVALAGWVVVRIQERVQDLEYSTLEHETESYLQEGHYRLALPKMTRMLEMAIDHGNRSRIEGTLDQLEELLQAGASAGPSDSNDLRRAIERLPDDYDLQKHTRLNQMRRGRP